MTIAVNSYATSGTFTGSLTVNAGVTLCLQGTAAIALTGALVNNGTIDHKASGGFTAAHDVTNSGTIKTTTAGFSQSSSAKTLINNAGATFIIAGNITMEGDITNAGIIQSTGGTFTKTYTGTYYHGLTGGHLLIYGNIRLEGTIENCGTIEITNSGVLTNSGTADPLTNSAGSTIIIRGAGLTSQIESEFYNHGNVIIEGNWSTTQTADFLINYSDGYIRVCGNFTTAQDWNNYGTVDILGTYTNTNASDLVSNYAGGIWNVTDDLILQTSIINEGCITVGDLFSKENLSSEDVTIRNGGTVFASRFIADNGDLAGGSSAANRGYLRVSGNTQTLNTVNLTGYLDLTDEGHIGVSPYFDSESPAYSYPTANMTDGGTPPCTKATLIACGASYTAGTGSCATVPLPITLAEFKTECKNGEMQLSWLTASETNNDFFTIERAADAVNYEPVGIVDSKAPGGNSVSTLNYSFTDNSFPKEESANNNMFYYRLKQTDFDGQFTYSFISAATCSNYCIGDVNVVSDDNFIRLNIESICSTFVDLSIYNALGQIISTKRVFVEAGTNNIQMDANAIAQGIYILKATTINQSFQKKFGKLQ